MLNPFSFQKVLNVLSSLFFIGLIVFVLYSYRNPGFHPDITIINTPEIINMAKKIPSDGILMTTPDGFVYLKVSNDYIKKLYPLLLPYLSNEEKKCIDTANIVSGSHISVFYPKDRIKHLTTIGKNYSFTIKNVKKVSFTKLINHQKTKVTWYVISITVPELEQYIKKYNKDKSLHISIAEDKRLVSNGQCLFINKY